MHIGFEMPSWFDLEEIPVTATTRDDEKGLLRSVDLVNEEIQKLMVSDGIAADKIVVGGFSQGAAMAALVSALCPQKVAGCVMLSGWTPLRAGFSDSLKHTGIPLFAGHGESDDKVLFSLGKQSSELMADSGFQVTFRSYPGMYHQTCGQEMRDLSSWLREIFQL